MKSHIAQLFRSFIEPVCRADNSSKLRQSEAKIEQLNKLLKDKERTIDALNHQLSLHESQLMKITGKDQLTGLPNRHIFKEYLTSSLKRAIRLGYSLSLLLIDIDDMHEINLKYGHDIGEHVLVEISKIIQSSVREIDLAARWGAEEMAAVLHETDMEAATVVAERIRKRITALNIKDPKTGNPLGVSATIAIASYPKHGCDPELLLEITREALQQARSKARGQVVVADVTSA